MYRNRQKKVEYFLLVIKYSNFYFTFKACSYSLYVRFPKIPVPLLHRSVVYIILSVCDLLSVCQSKRALKLRVKEQMRHGSKAKVSE